jgi:diguanylate cyclase (GGDEF)-like protein
MCAAATVVWALANRISDNPSLDGGFLLWSVGVQFFGFASFALVVEALRTQTSRAGRDSLTQLANRRTLERYLDREMARFKRTGEPLTLGYIDIDDFKLVNDRLGHDTGDRLLQTVGRTLEAHIRPTDLAVRLGGDEFAVILSGAQEASVRTTFEKLRTRLLQAMVANEWPVTFSVGVATFSTPPTSTEEILKSADRLMYAVKQQGKNQLAYAVN